MVIDEDVVRKLVLRSSYQIPCAQLTNNLTKQIVRTMAKSFSTHIQEICGSGKQCYNNFLICNTIQIQSQCKK
mgnify:CR=1 FL=1